MKKEGFISGLGIKFFNGLVLRIHDNNRLLWGGIKEKERLEKKFNELVELLEQSYTIDELVEKVDELRPEINGTGWIQRDQMRGTILDFLEESRAEL